MTLALRDKRVVVFGLGKSGVSALKLLVREGAQVTCMDDRHADSAVTASLKAQVPGWTGTRIEAPSVARLLEHELLVVSPGVPLARPEIVEARAEGLRTVGEIELAFHFLPADAPKIGITGTNGKSTTTALCGELFRQGGFDPFVGGNLGLPLSEAALEAKPRRAYIIELSSFQLEAVDAFKVDGAAILNLTPDHLDRYANSEAYGSAKARIFRNQGAQDVSVVNADDGPVAAYARQSQAPLFGFSRSANARSGNIVAGNRYAGVAYVEGGRTLVLPGDERYAVENRSLRGIHNLENAMAAALLARRLGVSEEAVRAGLASFPGLPHRMESARTVSGVEWVNDSKATNVESTLVALAAFEKRVWLILGGKGKGAPYEPLVHASLGKVEGVLTVGKDAPTIEAAFRGHCPVHSCGTLAGAVAKAHSLATSGDTVLLSPACASLDQFKSFEERGDLFKRLVGELG